jgi:hypothetical protein
VRSTVVPTLQINARKDGAHMHQTKTVSRFLGVALFFASFTSSVALASTSTASNPTSLESFSDKTKIFFSGTVTTGCSYNTQIWVYYVDVPGIQAMALAAFLSEAKLTCEYTCTPSFARATSCTITH